jgi:hypothetical protein
MEEGMKSARPRVPFGILPIIIAAILWPAAAHAQKLYKCQKDGKVFFSNTPCTGAAGSVQSSSPLQSPVTTLAGPAPGKAVSADDKELLARIQRDYADLTAKCEAGDQQVCDLLACVLKADRAACARAEGRMSGNGWRELSRRENRLPRADSELGTVYDKELEIVVQCVPGAAIHRVYWRGEGSVYLRNGIRVMNPFTGKEEREPGSRYPTVDEAAEAACGRKAEAGSQKPEVGSQQPEKSR